MKELGIISHISNKGRVIARSKKTPAFGLAVFNGEKNRLGIISDVFGPTKNPYISIKVLAKNSKNLENLVGEVIYVASKPNRKWRSRKRRKK